jgi:hypothetical protein
MRKVLLVSGLASLLVLLAYALQARFTQAFPDRPAGNRNGSDNLWDYAFQIENTTGHEIHVRVLENGEAIVDALVPRSLREVNQDLGTLDPDPVSVIRVLASLHESTPSLEVEELSRLGIKRSFRVAGFTSRPDLDFRIVVSNQGLSLTQDFSMPDNLTDEEHQLPPEEQKKRRALERKSVDATVTFFLLNQSGKPVHLRALLDGAELFDITIPATRPPSEVHQVHDPGCPYAVRTVPLNPLAKTLEIDETQSLNVQRSFRLKEFDTRRGTDFRVSVTAKTLEVTRGKFAY